MKIKSFLKKTGLLMLATVSFSALVTLASCKVQNEEPPVVIPQPPEPDKVPMEKVNDLLSKLEGGNYTVSTKNSNGVIIDTYTIEGNNCKILNHKTLNRNINIVENKIPYIFTYDLNSGVWYKDEAAEIFNVKDVVYNKLSKMKWNSFDVETNKYETTLDGLNYSIIFTSNGVLMSGAENLEILNIGTAKIEYPKEYVDLTCKEIPMETINDFLNDLKTKSFTLEQNIYGKYTRLEVEGENYHVYELNDNVGTIYEKQGDKHYVYAFSKEDGKWHKNETAAFDVKQELFLDLVLNGEWTGYNKEENMYSLKFSSDKEVSLTPIYNVRFQDSGVYIDGLEGEAQYSKIGTTTLNLPKDYVDHTVETPDPKPPVDEQYIYTIDEAGKYNFNIVLMKEVMENWMKGDNQFGKDVLAEKYYNDTLVSEGIYYIDASKEKIEMGLLYRNDKYHAFGTFKLQDTALFAGFEQGQYQTKDDFVKYLNSIKKTKYSCPDGIEIDEKFGEMDEKCEIIMNNILNKLATTGYQGNNISNEGTKVTDFANLDRTNFIFGFKGKTSDSYVGFGLGEIKSWSLYLILFNDKNKLEYIRVGIVTTLSNGAKDEYENVLNNTDKTWMIAGIERKSIDDSRVFYQEAENTKTLAATQKSSKRIAVRKSKDNELKK